MPPKLLSVCTQSHADILSLNTPSIPHVFYVTPYLPFAWSSRLWVQIMFFLCPVRTEVERGNWLLKDYWVVQPVLGGKVVIADATVKAQVYN